ncbi:MULTISPECIES: branched-chain amino acid ABC transporter substrate-binding protein [Bradyrhizobium]|jgi:branched-chain amino acid transport system substrate-binding protein|uniref:Branched-chain amino acid ABC transporter substrate-binding protein n=1 Tax=Bradyrhizobium elkanii TaxID=29448 RepID=A0A4U6S6F4_BRAEL|nr:MULTISPECIES: branched-chain amino acid ABC transporter substrate-binding protein [Bradyrhizobium]MBR1159528.1 branched-chain amino acid ABC transporter substrate-binding protein [Bradyrhizobium elkanii]MCS3452955.1 branched-chain amino acid transport system substrate-binding protein [Bradyrhizobium elkanii]MCS3564939.1 branched-chain amino acid transport system substrate-binding protein [Bradyrhizobium elkanii]MCW2145231.1 branched-chain amino acid transport system substrate-binding protein
MHRLIVAAAAALTVLGGAASAQESIKIGYIDPLSGGGASVGEGGLKTFQYLADELNAKGGILGHKVEIVPLDNKTNPQESLVQAQKAVDAGVHYITQGNGSSVGAALEDFVTKHNSRNPGKEVLYFNYAAVDPAMTNEKCSYWHFRWDANSDIKMEALTNYMKGQPSIKKVYLINMDYSFGQSVRSTARKMLGEKRPDIQVVGDELHPMLKVTDFSPYIAKIKASGADTVVTGNWGQDFALLLKAAADAGLKVNWYTYYAGGAGGPTAIKQAGLESQVFQISEGVPNSGNKAAMDFEKDFRAKTGISVWYPRAVNEMRMFKAAAEKANSIDPVKVAAALEGMKFEVFDGGEGFIRKDDHQFFQPIYISSFGSLADKTKEPFDEENTGWGWRIVSKIDTAQTMLPTTCNMKRP